MYNLQKIFLLQMFYFFVNLLYYKKNFFAFIHSPCFRLYYNSIFTNKYIPKLTTAKNVTFYLLIN